MYIALRIIGLVLAISGASASFAAKKVVSLIKKSEPEANEILNFKSYMLLVVIVGVVVAIVPEYMAGR